VVEYNNSQYSPPQSLIDETRARIESLTEHSKKEGFTFFDDVLGRVDDVNVHSNKLLLKFSKTSYFHFAALNKGLDLPLSDMSDNTTLRSFLNEDPYDLRSSMLPNPLGVVTSLVLEPENKIVLTIHSNRSFEGSGMMTAPIGGSLSIKEEDLNFSGLPDPFRTIVREANEPELIGQVSLSLKEKDLLEIQKNRAKDKWEIERQYIAHPEEILKYLSVKNWSPSAWASTFLSVISINRDQG
jgi:hypothetical protein